MSTHYHSQYWAHALTLQSASDNIDNLSRSIANAKVDLKPQQVDAALFAFRSPLSKGAILADEVGLGKTIEAGIVIAQRWAERRRKTLLILPATLRKQWQQEMEEKFYLPSVILESQNFNIMRRDGYPNPFDQQEKIVACSYHFASAKADEVRRVNWDLVVIDEAHRLRNVYKTSKKMAKNISEAVSHCQKLLLTATPLQNTLMELFGLVSVIDPHVFGDPASFREQFARANDEERRNALLRERIRPLCTRTLRQKAASLSQREQWLLSLTQHELGDQAVFDPKRPRFFYTGPDVRMGNYNLAWKKAKKNGDIFYRADHALAAMLINRAIDRDLPASHITFDYKAHGTRIAALEKHIGSSGWLELSKLSVESFETEEFLVFAAKTDGGRLLDGELCRKLMSLPGTVAETNDDGIHEKTLDHARNSETE